MPISLRCPCGKALKVRDEAAGKKVKCPGCDTLLLVPLAEGEPEAAAPQVRVPPRIVRPAPPPHDEDDEDREEQPARRRPPAVKSSKRGRGQEILQTVLGVLILAGLGVAVWFFFLRGRFSEGPWEEFTSAPGAFKVMLPGKPQSLTQMIQTPEGPVTQHLFKVEFPKLREAFVVGYVDYPAKMTEAGPEAIVNAELNMLYNAPKALRRKERKEAAAVAPGMMAGEVNLVTTNEGTIRVKAIMVKQRLFTLMVRGPHDEASEELAKKLYDSFEIVGTVPAPPAPQQNAGGPPPDAPGPKAPPEKAPEPAGPKRATGPFRGHTEDIEGIALSTQGDRLATVARDGTLRVWEYPSGKELAMAQLRDDFRTPNSVAFAPDGKTLAVGLGGPGEKLLLWDLEGRTEKARAPADRSALYLAFSANGKHLIFAPIGRIYRLDPTDPAKRQEISVGDCPVLTPDGKRVLFWAYEELMTYDLDAGGRPKSLPARTRYKDRVRATALSGDGRLLAVGTGQQVHLWDAEKLVSLGKEIRTIPTGQLVLSARGDVLVVRNDEGYATYALPGGKELARERIRGLRRVLLAPDGKLVLVHGPNLSFRELSAKK